MRVITYILLTLSCLFALNVFIAASSPTYKTFLQEVKWNFTPGSTTTIVRDKRLTAADIRTDKLIRSLDRLGEKVEAIEIHSGLTPESSSSGVIGTGASLSGITSTGTTASGSIIPVAELKLPGSLLARLMPQFLPTKTDNELVFGIKKLKSEEYLTYVDKRKKLKIYVFGTNYEALKSEFRLTENLYKVNETDTFFSYTFFLNPPKKDGKIRFVTQIDNRPIGIEVPQSAYPLLKKLLTK